MRSSGDNLTFGAGTQEKMERYRRQLLAAGWREPENQNLTGLHWRFFLQQTSLTAFVINLNGKADGVEVVYGYASTAFTRMAGDENALVQNGIFDEAINIREKVVIRVEMDEQMARARIQAMYRQFQFTEKDELLKLAKAKRKAFIDQIHAVLKPLGFKKKANEWTKLLEEDYYLKFQAQKSMFSDEYYFNIIIRRKAAMDGRDCFYRRIAPDDLYPMDWQAIAQETWDDFLNETVVHALKRLIHTPLYELGKAQDIWSHCACSRRQCETCWVEKNLWEDTV